MAKKQKRNLRFIGELRQRGEWIARLAWSPDGCQIGAGSIGGFITVWDLATLERRLDIQTPAVHILNVIWTPDGKRILTSNECGEIFIHESENGKLVGRLEVPDKIRNRSNFGREDGRRDVHGMALLSDSRTIVGGGPFGLLAWDLERGTLNHHSFEHRDIISLAVSADGKRLASTSYEGEVCIWDVDTFRVQKRILPATFSAALAWSPNGKLVASVTGKSIAFWDAKSGALLHVLEGHTADPRALSFSSDGRLFASRAGQDNATAKNSAYDGRVLIWRTDSWHLHAVLEETAAWYLFTGLGFAPDGHRLATTAKRDRAIHVWEIGSPQPGRRPYSSVLYKNAKVALVGDSGVGKSGLALVLTGQKFVATHSTHARRVTILNTQKIKVSEKKHQIRETVLWDLAGQAGYRLIHQLHLDDIALALIVFDSRDERDPFSGARHWNRALLNARLSNPQLGDLPKRLLVAARIDRGPVSVSRKRIDELCSELGIDCGYIPTSAKEGTGVDALLTAISKNVPWPLLPTITSNARFKKIKAYLEAESRTGRTLATMDELYRGFIKKSRTSGGRERKAEFSACVERLEWLGLLRRFSFGNLVLLQAELLDAYAASIIFAAKQEPDGMGTISEQKILAGDFSVPSDERINDRSQESLLLLATVEDLVRHEVALRETSEDGSFLVFPSQLTRENPDLPDPIGKSIVINFGGPVINIYATLVVRLSHSGFFHLKALWRNAATFECGVAGVFGVFLSDMGEGAGKLTIFYDSVLDETAKQQFENYTATHVIRRALPQTVKKLRVLVCPSQTCQTPVSEVSIERRKARGFDWIDCNVCGQRIQLTLEAPSPEASVAAANMIKDIDVSADRRREKDAELLAASGEMLTAVFKKWLGADSGTVALVFTDVVGSTAMAIELGDESMDEVRKKHFDSAYRAASRNEGYVIKTIGDAFMVAFRTSVKALDFAVELADSTGHERVAIRAGIHVGPVRVDGEDVFGTMVNFTSRIVSYITGPEIWLSNRVYEDIQLEKAKSHQTLSYVEHTDCQLKGFKESQRLWAVLARVG